MKLEQSQIKTLLLEIEAIQNKIETLKNLESELENQLTNLFIVIKYELRNQKINPNLSSHFFLIKHNGFWIYKLANSVSKEKLENLE